MSIATAASRSSPLAVKAVLFDLDGTLVHSAPDLAAAVNAMLKDLGRPEVPIETVMRWIGNGLLRLVKRALTGAMDGEPDAALFERGFALLKQHYGANLSVLTRPYPEAIDMLEALRAHGFVLGCVTNKSAQFTQPLLEQLDLAKYFATVVSGDTTPVRKPDPAPLLHACENLGIRPTQAVLVGDSANDVGAARAAGMPVICVSYGYNHGRDVRELAPDGVVDSLAELPQYLSFTTA